MAGDAFGWVFPITGLRRGQLSAELDNGYLETGSRADNPRVQSGIDMKLQPFDFFTTGNRRGMC